MTARKVTSEASSASTCAYADDSGSVGTALKILLMFKRSASVRITDVARELGIARSTAHRQLTTLEHHGFVTQQAGTKAYTAGPILVNIGLEAAGALDLRTVARPELEKLRNATSESIGLFVLESREVVVLDLVQGTRRLRVVERVGDRRPAHLTAAGRAMLAALGTSALHRLYPSAELVPLQPSMRTRNDLEKELDRIKQQGYAAAHDESGDGFVGVAAAIVHRNDGVVGAVSLASPTVRLTDDLRTAYGSAVIDTAARIATGLP